MAAAAVAVAAVLVVAAELVVAVVAVVVAVAAVEVVAAGHPCLQDLQDQALDLRAPACHRV